MNIISAIKKTTLLFLLGFPLFVSAQREYDNWYFGRKAALYFQNGGAPVVKNDNAMDTYNSGSSTCISDAATGRLLFYSDGETVWNRNHTVMKNGTNITTQFRSQDVIAVPFPGSTTKYYIFTVTQNYILCATVIDMAGDGGLGEVIKKGDFIYNQNVCDAITVAKHGGKNGYWLIAHERANNKFVAFNITDTGINRKPVESLVGTPTDAYGNLVTNNSGTKLAATHDFKNNGIAEIFDFNKICGTVTNAVTLPKIPEWDRSFSVAFSPNDSFLYVAYQHYLLQYPVNGINNWTDILTTTQSLNSILLGPNNKLYIRADRKLIHRLEFPDSSGHKSKFVASVININTDDSEFPKIIHDRSTKTGITINYLNTCLGDTTKFNYSALFTPDSLQWNFGDTASASNTSNQAKPWHYYKTTGNYTVTVKWYLCGLQFSQTKTIKIVSPGPINIGPDTGVCHNGSYTLSSNVGGGNYLWSTGETTGDITITKPGSYWLKVTNGSCSGSDTAYIRQYAPILVELGGDYAICDDNNELVKLDAGKGYEHYKWTPTGDTSQWIIVNKAGDYYVVVEDFRGCRGNDGSKISRLCDFTFFLPNSFTPNDDILNDVFAPVFSDIYDYQLDIYNRWGERVFISNSPQKGWDGNYKGQACPVDAYMWRVRFKGNHNKILRIYNYNGNVQLIR